MGKQNEEVIFEREYDCNDLCDAEQHVGEAFEEDDEQFESNVTYRVTITRLIDE